MAYSAHEHEADRAAPDRFAEAGGQPGSSGKAQASGCLEANHRNFQGATPGPGSGPVGGRVASEGEQAEIAACSSFSTPIITTNWLTTPSLGETLGGGLRVSRLMFSFPSFPFRKASKVGWRSSTGSDREMSRSMRTRDFRIASRRLPSSPFRRFITRQNGELG